MARVEFSIGSDEQYPVYRPYEVGFCGAINVYSLSAEEYADLLEVNERYEEWQRKLGDLKPNGWVPPPPPKQPTKEELAFRAYQLSDEYLDKIAPLP